MPKNTNEMNNLNIFNIISGSKNDSFRCKLKNNFSKNFQFFLNVFVARKEAKLFRPLGVRTALSKVSKLTGYKKFVSFIFL